MKRSIAYIPAHALSRPRPIYRLERDGDVIPLRHRHGHPTAGPIVGFALLAVVAWMLIAALLATLARSGQDVATQLARGWPWW